MKRFVLLWLLVSSLTALGQGVNVSGQVNGVNAQPLAGASIHVLNTSLGAITDQSGKFTLVNLPAGQYKIEISAIGYANLNRDLTVKEGGSPEEIIIQLEEASIRLDAVVVTAQKQEEEVQSIPSSISALSARQVQQYRLWDIKDIAAIVPNLSSADPGDLRNVTSIRGITSTSYDPAVATYVDGVNQFSLDTYIPQLFDVERIEVLRGPQGTLYGRNAMGGVINIITKQPTNSTTGFVEASFGNYGQQRYTAGIRTPLVKNKLFLGISGLFDQMDGYYTNTFNNSHFDKRHNVTGNMYLKYLVSSRWALTLNVKHSSNRNDGTFPLTGSVDEAFANPFKVNQNAVSRIIDNVMNGSFTAAYSGQKMNFTSQTSYQSNYRYYRGPLDGDFSPYDYYTIYDNYGNKWNNGKVYTQEFKLTSPASTSSPLNWTTGAYFYYQDSPVKQATRFGKDAAPIAGDSLFSIINTTKSVNKGMAYFGQVTYTIQKLEITAGLRYDYEVKRQNVLGEYQHDPNPDPIFAIRPDTSASVSYSALSPKLGVAYRVSDHHVFFTSYNRGFRTGGLTSFSADPTSPPLYSFKPEYSNNVEIGLKNTFLDNRLRANLSAFFISVNNAQIPTLVLPQAVTITKNAGKLSSQGVELELAAAPVKGFQIESNWGMVNAKYETLRLPENGVEVDYHGNKQIFTPTATAMLAMQYQYTVGAAQSWRLVVRGEWKYLGDQYFDLANKIRQPGYDLLNTRFGVAYKKFEVMFWGRNLTNRKYISYAYDFGATHLGNPRTLGVTLRHSF